MKILPTWARGRCPARYRPDARIGRPTPNHTPNRWPPRHGCHYGRVYRFLVTPRWLGLAALILVLATIMAGLGDWQLHRYRQRADLNARIDAAQRVAPVTVTDVLRPGVAAPKS